MDAILEFFQRIFNLFGNGTAETFVSYLRDLFAKIIPTKE